MPFMELGVKCRIRDKRLSRMTIVEVEYDATQEVISFITAVSGRLKNNSFVYYLQAFLCMSRNDIVFHKVIHKNQTIYLVENKKFSLFEIKPVHLQIVKEGNHE